MLNSLKLNVLFVIAVCLSSISSFGASTGVIKPASLREILWVRVVNMTLGTENMRRREMFNRFIAEDRFCELNIRYQKMIILPACREKIDMEMDFTKDFCCWFDTLFEKK